MKATYLGKGGDMTNEEVRKLHLMHNCVGKGWHEKLVIPFLNALKGHSKTVRILQIKEKFGTLRLYISGPEWAQDLAEALETVSSQMCEDCGRWGGWTYPERAIPTHVTHAPVKGWILTLCDECREKANAV